MTGRACQWLDMAAENEKAARCAHEKGWYRASVSRAYYAYYQAATALFIHAGMKPPARGNWAHVRVAVLFEEQESRRVLKHRAIEFKQAFMQCWFARSSADYGPIDEVGTREAKQTRRWAGMMMEAACGVLGYDPRRTDRKD